jgi:hypothetical protein
MNCQCVLYRPSRRTGWGRIHHDASHPANSSPGAWRCPISWSGDRPATPTEEGPGEHVGQHPAHLRAFQPEVEAAVEERYGVLKVSMAKEWQHPQSALTPLRQASAGATTPKITHAPTSLRAARQRSGLPRSPFAPLPSSHSFHSMTASMRKRSKVQLFLSVLYCTLGREYILGYGMLHGRSPNLGTAHTSSIVEESV